MNEQTYPDDSRTRHAKAVADGAAVEARRRGLSDDEINAEWWAWFEEELRSS
jgi:hypothetical protein